MFEAEDLVYWKKRALAAEAEVDRLTQVAGLERKPACPACGSRNVYTAGLQRSCHVCNTCWYIAPSTVSSSIGKE